MRKPAKVRENPKTRIVRAPPEGTNLAEIAERVKYVASTYHNATDPGHRRRADATVCPKEVSKRQKRTQLWLRNAIRAGRTGTWRGGFPRYVWHREGDVIYEARQGAPGSGEYHGYPLDPNQTVRGL